LKGGKSEKGNGLKEAEKRHSNMRELYQRKGARTKKKAVTSNAAKKGCGKKATKEPYFEPGERTPTGIAFVKKELKEVRFEKKTFGTGPAKTVHRLCAAGGSEPHYYEEESRDPLGGRMDNL